MCNFFSLVETRSGNIKALPGLSNSHAVICSTFGLDEDKVNKYECYNTSLGLRVDVDQVVFEPNTEVIRDFVKRIYTVPDTPFSETFRRGVVTPAGAACWPHKYRYIHYLYDQYRKVDLKYDQIVKHLHQVGNFLFGGALTICKLALRTSKSEVRKPTRANIDIDDLAFGALLRSKRVVQYYASQCLGDVNLEDVAELFPIGLYTNGDFDCVDLRESLIAYLLYTRIDQVDVLRLNITSIKLYHQKGWVMEVVATNLPEGFEGVHEYV